MPKIPTTRDSGAKRWCFTLLNYTATDETKIQNLGRPSICSYLVYGRENTKTNTPHLQGFISLTTKQRFTALKKLLGDTAHIEKARGTDQQNLTYCSKEDPSPFVYGKPKTGTIERRGGHRGEVAYELACIIGRTEKNDPPTEKELEITKEKGIALIFHGKRIDTLADKLRFEQLKKECLEEYTKVNWKPFQTRNHSHMPNKTRQTNNSI
ncbi:replication associated protein [Plakobranchus ocellatus]|uniref:Replication associated protein n=1 Tax=Plakobranchus ocellatus TaxID=259542 RepID=A0AAV3YYF1_9GAST|nr:replication associated protein [Plakobranchus ocellatus]